MAEMTSTISGVRRGLSGRRRTIFLLCALLATMVFLTVIPTAWATPGEAPLDQAKPTPMFSCGGPYELPGGLASASVPYGGYLYYYYYGYGGAPGGYYPGYWTGYNAPSYCPGNYYPNGYYWPNYPSYPSCPGYNGCYPSGPYW